MPVIDGRFSALPAEEDDFVVHAAGEVEEARIQIFDLDAYLVDFRLMMWSALIEVPVVLLLRPARMPKSAAPEVAAE